MKTLLVCLALVAASAAAQAQYPRVISFSGFNWSVKTSAGRVGPGPNYFSDSVNNVWVDAQGRLHLKITKVGGRWNCAEVVCQSSLGYGTYRWTLDSAVDALDRNVVLGLFTWNDDPAYNHREIDIEFSRWGAANNQNAQYVVQPYTNAANIVRWNMPAGYPQSTHSFDWSASSIDFLSLGGATTLQQWAYAGPDIPVPGGENARVNLWLYRGSAPSNRLPVEVIISRFEFVP
jgi:hypothetical protein